jgi:hypothetical protein
MQFKPERYNQKNVKGVLMALPLRAEYSIQLKAMLIVIILQCSLISLTKAELIYNEDNIEVHLIKSRSSKVHIISAQDESTPLFDLMEKPVGDGIADFKIQDSTIQKLAQKYPKIFADGSLAFLEVYYFQKGKKLPATKSIKADPKLGRPIASYYLTNKSYVHHSELRGKRAPTPVWRFYRNVERKKLPYGSVKHGELFINTYKNAKNWKEADYTGDNQSKENARIKVAKALPSAGKVSPDYVHSLGYKNGTYLVTVDKVDYFFISALKITNSKTQPILVAAIHDIGKDAMIADFDFTLTRDTRGHYGVGYQLSDQEIQRFNEKVAPAILQIDSNPGSITVLHHLKDLPLSETHARYGRGYNETTEPVIFQSTYKGQAGHWEPVYSKMSWDHKGNVGAMVHGGRYAYSYNSKARGIEEIKINRDVYGVWV